jgi:hypothetical protein
VNSQEASIDEVRIRQQELPNKGIKIAMHLFVSILQCLARFLFGAHFTERISPRFHRSAEAFSLRFRSGDDHWPSVGWMKVRLLLDEFGGLPCRRMVLLRVLNVQRVNLRAKSIQSEGFLPETSPPLYLRTCFSPPEFRGR